jgi:hypothetical protein
VYVRLIREQTGVTFLNPFTQPVTTNNINTLTSLTVYYSIVCVMGIDFVYSDGTIVSTGSSAYSGKLSGQLSGQKTLDLTNKNLYEVDNYCSETSDFIRFCSMSNTGVKTCIDNGNYAKMPNKFICLKNMTIVSFVGNHFTGYNGFYCISNLGVNVVTTGDLNTTC